MRSACTIRSPALFLRRAACFILPKTHKNPLWEASPFPTAGFIKLHQKLRLPQPGKASHLHVQAVLAAVHAVKLIVVAGQDRVQQNA